MQMHSAFYYFYSHIIPDSDQNKKTDQLKIDRFNINEIKIRNDHQHHHPQTNHLRI